MAFKKNPRFDAELVRSAGMRTHLTRVAGDVVREIEAGAPSWLKRAGARFETVTTTDGVDARVVSSFWHLPEYGTRHTPAHPYVRPGATAALDEHGGKLTGPNP